MRGEDAPPASLFSHIQVEDRIPADHALGVIRTLIDRPPQAASANHANTRRAIHPALLA